MTDQKLEWMYRNSNEAVDREEYLLGKPIDKAFEQNSYGNEIEKDCLPSSIFANSSSNIQVDVIRKMKEDPLEVIRQQEIERRKQLLKNPVKLKKLQNMLKEKQSQQEKEEERKKKKLRINSPEESQDIDSLLTSRYLRLMKKHRIKSLAELNSLKIHKKKKKKKKKAHSESSDTDSDKNQRKERKHTKRKIDLSESDSEDLYQSKAKIHRDMKISSRSKRHDDSSESDSGAKRKYKDRKDSNRSMDKKVTSYSGSDSELVDKKKLKIFKNIRTKRKNHYSYESSDRDRETQGETCKNYKTNIRNKSFSLGEGGIGEKQIIEHSDSDNDRKTSGKSKIKKGNSEKLPINYKSSLNAKKNNLGYKRYALHLKKSNSYKESQTTDIKKRSRSKSPPTKKYVNESSILKKFSGRDDSKKNEYREYKVNSLPYREKKSKDLSEKEKQKKLEEMMSNAKWRDDLRIKNITKYKKEEAFENKEDYNEDFIRNQMLLATSSGSVEANIKSNINNIQRSKFSMSENFVRR